MKTETQKTIIALSFSFTLAIGAEQNPALAERKPNTPSDAKLIVWGTVEEVVRDETNEVTNFKVKIQVENQERGFVRGNAVWVECFQRKPTAPKVPAENGHNAIPVEGQFIRALMLQPRRGAFEGIYPDWFHELPHLSVLAGCS